MNNRLQYALYGAGFGLCFPIVATAVASSLAGESVLQVQTDQPLLWIINTAPFILGLIASFAGQRQDRVSDMLSEQEARSDELEKANEELIEARRLKSEFLANVSHELRTPLNAIIGFSRILRRKADGKLDAKQMRNIQRVLDSGLQLLDLVNDLLDIERIEAGMLTINVNDFDAIALTEELLASLKPRAIEKGLMVKFVHHDIRHLRTDANRLRQLMTNLLVNSIKYSDSGQILLTFSRENGRFSIDVKDEGIGIPKASLPHIFEPFRQVDGSSTRSRGGVGLGLNLVRQLSEALGGEVSVVSTEGSGSTFTLSFSDEIVVQHEGLDIVERSEEVFAIEGDGPLVLVIDDDNSALDIASVELSEAGYRVHVANGGRVGLDLARALKPDVIVLDIVMPEVDGWSVLQELRADEELSETPVVVASFMDKVKKSEGLGVTGWITKPFTTTSFRSFVSTVEAREIEEVLVVEDDPATLALIVQHFESTNTRVRTAVDGPAALRSLTGRMPDAVVMDLMIPMIDGTDVIRQLREMKGGAELPVVVYTAKTLSDTEHSDLSAVVLDVVQKADSHSVETVVERISEAILEEP